MSFYKYRTDPDNFATLDNREADTDRIVDIHFTDRPLAATWEPVKFRPFKEETNPEGDFPSLSCYNPIPVVSQRAWDALAPLIGNSCEALPIIRAKAKGQFYLIHVIETIDCLDHAKCVIDRRREGDIREVTTYSFKANALDGKHIFKIPNQGLAGMIGATFVDEEFRKVVESHKLRGLRFKPLKMK
jgi:hypothetical protein